MRGAPQALRADRAGLVSWVVILSVVTLNLVQQPGLITFDTKLDLQFNPADFLYRSLDVWNGDSTLGGLQNQASGYLVPMGPAFWLGDVLPVPMWIWERLWTAAVMLLAYFGTVRLARSWPGISEAGAILAGLTYMLAPRVLVTVGGISGETLPSAILPWTVLPLVLYLRGRLPAWVAFLWSAATIPWMGGQNATLVVACLVLPGLLLLLAAGRSWSRRVRDAAAWTGLAIVASAWWLVPLFVLGGYAPPWLNFIESSTDTASDVGWLAAFRGVSHWVAFFPDGGTAGWVGAYELASSSLLLVTTVLVAGAGLVGLAQPTLWLRRPLVVSMLVGLAVLTLGSADPAGSVFGREWLDALDDALTPLRNIHKFDPIVRLPLALGLGGFATAVVPQLVAAARGLSVRRRALAGTGLTAALAVLICAAAQPAVSGHLRVSDGVRDISAPWQAAVGFLQQQEGPTEVLVLPGNGFAVQTWGRTTDEPIQVIGSPPWSVRTQNTIAPAATVRMLDEIEAQVNLGRPITGLASTLRRLGITHVILRNDLDPVQTTAPPPAVVMASVAGSTGLTPLADFGRTAEGFPAVAVLAVDAERPDPKVAISDWDSREVVQGGPEALNDLTQLGLVSEDEPVVLADGGDDAAAADIVTDSNQRVERSFSRITDSASGVMTADDGFRQQRLVHDYVGGTVPSATTDAEYDGASAIVASSSGGYADVLGPVFQDEHPYAAFDASPFTAWASAPFVPPVGQWIEARFPEPVEPATVSLLFDAATGADVSRVRIETDAGSVDAAVGPDGSAESVALPPGATTRLRIAVEEVGSRAWQVRLANVAVEGIEIRRSLRVPGEVSAGTSMVFRSEPSRRACVVAGTRVECEEAWQRETPETPGFDRTVDVTESGTWRVVGRAVATDGPALQRLFAPLGKEQVDVEATSSFAGDPAVLGSNAYDGREDTSWYASPLDPAPSLQLSWKQPRTIRSVRAVLAAGQPGELPAELVVDPLTPGIEPQVVETSGERAGSMTPVRTNRLRITPLADPDRTEPAGIGELSISGLDDLRQTVDPTAQTGLLCGFGPTIEVDGRTVQTKVLGDLSQVVRGGELAVVPCDDGLLDMDAGTQRIRVTNPAGFAVSRLWLVPAEPVAEPVRGASDARVVRWTPTERTIEVSTEDDAVLSVAESENSGWEARLHGARLDPVVVDGWMQGWRLPAGSDGEVSLVYAPQQPYRIGIVAGLTLAALLNVAALVTLVVWRRRGSGRTGARVAPFSYRGPGAVGARASGPGRLVAVLGVGVLALVSFPLACGALAAFVTRGLRLAVVCGASVAALLVAAAAALVGVDSIVLPPAAANVVTAAAVGLVAGRVLFGDDDLRDGDQA